MGNDQSSSRHEPKPSAAPTKSALSRSRSVRANANGLEKSQIENNKFLRPNNSLLKQSMPYNMHGVSSVDPFSSANAGGVDSPQWGWYINTTPPTPEVYYRPHKTRKPDPSRKQDSSSDTSEATAATEVSSGTTPGSSAHPNPVFQNLQDNKNKAAHMGWPSVPL